LRYNTRKNIALLELIELHTTREGGKEKEEVSFHYLKSKKRREKKLGSCGTPAKKRHPLWRERSAAPNLLKINEGSRGKREGKESPLKAPKTGEPGAVDVTYHSGKGKNADVRSDKEVGRGKKKAPSCVRRTLLLERQKKVAPLGNL